MPILSLEFKKKYRKKEELFPIWNQNLLKNKSPFSIITMAIYRQSSNFWQQNIKNLKFIHKKNNFWKDLTTC